MILRPYKSIDAKVIIKWLNDEETFIKWGGDYFGFYPINEEIINNKYFNQNGDCIESDNFYPLVFVDDNRVVGHFIIRYLNNDPKILRFGWVIVDNTIRSKGYGTKMLKLGLKYAFEILSANKVTIGVFENNLPGYYCYKKVGFKEVKTVNSIPFNIIEMEIFKEDYLK